MELDCRLFSYGNVVARDLPKAHAAWKPRGPLASRAIEAVKLPASPILPVLLLAAGTTPAGRLLLLCPASTPPPCSLLRKGSFSKPWQIPWAGAHRAPATVPKNAAVPLQGHAGRSPGPAPAPAPSPQQGDGLQFSSTTAKTKVTARGNCKQLLPTGPGRISAGVTGGVNFLRSLHAGSLTGKGI